MSKSTFYYVTPHAVDRFKDRFEGNGLRDSTSIRKMLTAIAHNGMQLQMPGKHSRGKVITDIDRRTGRRLFLVVLPDENAEHDRMIVKTVLTQDQACCTYGFTFPKEDVLADTSA